MTILGLPHETETFSRRTLLSAGTSLVAYASASQLLLSRAAFGQGQNQNEFTVQRKLVWINMSGGWDILETVDPKVNSTAKLDVAYSYNEAHRLSGSRADVRVGRHLPGLASLGSDLLLIRGLVMGTTSHDAGATYMDTGVLSNTGRVNAASIPAIVASESDATIPIIQLQGGMDPRTDRGLLNPVSLVRAQNLELYRSMYPTEKDLVERRMLMLDYLKKSVARVKSKAGANDRLSALEVAEEKIRGQIASGLGSKLMLTDADKAAFGTGENARGADAFALALKLIKNDLVSCVNLGVGGFDTHSNQDRALEGILPAFDKNITTFVQELKKAGKLDTTLIVLYSDFGRTAKINGSNGRDHWPVGGAAFIGGGIEGGRAAGGTDANLLAQYCDMTTGAPLASGGESQQLSPAHVGGAVLSLCLGDSYTYRNSYLKTDADCLTRLKS
jgi:hypothetical protein